MKKQVLLVLVYVAVVTLAVASDVPAVDEDVVEDRVKRALPGDVPVRPDAAKYLGRTFNFTSDIQPEMRTMQFTFVGKPVDFENFEIPSDPQFLDTLENFLRGRSLEDTVYVTVHLAEIEQKVARANEMKVMEVAELLKVESTQSADAEDEILNREQVDEYRFRIKHYPKILNLNAKELTEKDVNEEPVEDKTDPRPPVILEPVPPEPQKAGPSGLTRVKRKSTTASGTKWPTTINYAIAGGFTTAERKIILAAIQHWQQETCLNFVLSSSGNFLLFRKLTGCWSQVGRQGGAQMISIGNGCFRMAVVAHEIGHALGFWHEQSRPDRWRYVQILTGNILPGRAHNFVRRTWAEAETFGVPYDYGSVLHYSSTAFTTNPALNTIDAIEPDREQSMGQRWGLSHFDLKMANYKYCNHLCGGLTSATCQRGGYRNPRNCDTCKCPDGFAGTTCQIIKPGVSAACGATTRTATSTWTTFNSPHFSTPSWPPVDSECTWRIRALSSNVHIQLRIDAVTPGNPDPVRCDSFLEVRHADMERTGPRFCRGLAVPKMFISQGSEILLLLRINEIGHMKGFRASCRIQPCGGCGTTAAYATPCLNSQTYLCNGVYTVRTGFWGWGRTKKYRRNTCYRTARRCCPGYYLQGNNCARGIWSAWTGWDPCSGSCGACGFRSRTRTCPTSACPGSSTQTERCGTTPCPSRLRSRVSSTTKWWSTTYRQVYFIQPPWCCAGYRIVSNNCVP